MLAWFCTANCVSNSNGKNNAQCGRRCSPSGIDPCCICFAATKADGTVFTGYYNADATDKAVFAHNIQSDIVMDIIKANADTINGILEDGK